MNIRKIAVFTCLSIAGLYSILFALPALAQTAPTGAMGSANWAGYVAMNSTYKEVHGSWIVPTPTITSNSATSCDASWIGIGGMKSHDLIQSGTAAEVANGAIKYSAWYELLPSGPVTLPVTIHGGDSVTATVAEQSANTWLITFVNNTTGQKYQTTVNYTSSYSSAEWVEEMPLNGPVGASTSFIALDDFGTANFSNSFANDGTSEKNLVDLGAQKINMTSGSQILASASEIASDGSCFSVSKSGTGASATLAQATPKPAQTSAQSTQIPTQVIAQPATYSVQPTQVRTQPTLIPLGTTQTLGQPTQLVSQPARVVVASQAYAAYPQGYAYYPYPTAYRYYRYHR